MSGKHGSLPDKKQKRKQADCLIESQDEISDKCSQSLKTAKPNGASATTRRPRTRYKGIYRRENKFRAYLKVDNRQISLGSYSTDDEAARAVDKGRIFQGLAPVNFESESYEDDIACAADSIDQYAKLTRSQSRQSSKALLTSKAQLTSRFKGVVPRLGRWHAYMFWKKHHTFGSYRSEQEAAMMYDQACIYRNLHPVNFPDFPYNKEEIRQPADFGEFVEQKREQAMQATKAGQSSRFTGVSWSVLLNRWAVHLMIPAEQAGRPRTCLFLGCFDTDEEAAVVADKGRIRYGMKAVNFPDSQYDHHQISQAAKFVEQSRLEARRTIKARQFSRFTGVTWNRMVKKWEAYVHVSYLQPNQKKGFKKRILGFFANEEDAARAADIGRVQNGQKAVNSEELKLTTNRG
ncbi:hypothetical protein WJX82_005815 [Trebouxia sp. C0006]